MYLRVGQGLCSDRFNCDPTWPPARNRLLSDCEPLAPRRLHLYPPQFDLRHTGGGLCLARHLGRIRRPKFTFTFSRNSVSLQEAIT